jgi:hypothetical protein
MTGLRISAKQVNMTTSIIVITLSKHRRQWN